MKEYMTIKETAEKWGVSTRRVTTLCHEGRIKGVVKFGVSFAIPANSKNGTKKQELNPSNQRS